MVLSNDGKSLGKIFGRHTSVPYDHFKILSLDQKLGDELKFRKEIPSTFFLRSQIFIFELLSKLVLRGCRAYSRASKQNLRLTLEPVSLSSCRQRRATTRKRSPLVGFSLQKRTCAECIWVTRSERKLPTGKGRRGLREYLV